LRIWRQINQHHQGQVVQYAIGESGELTQIQRGFCPKRASEYHRHFQNKSKILGLIKQLKLLPKNQLARVLYLDGGIAVISRNELPHEIKAVIAEIAFTFPVEQITWKRRLSNLVVRSTLAPDGIGIRIKHNNTAFALIAEDVQVYVFWGEGEQKVKATVLGLKVDDGATTFKVSRSEGAVVLYLEIVYASQALWNWNGQLAGL